MLEHILQGFVVGILQGFQRLVQIAADIGLLVRDPQTLLDDLAFLLTLPEYRAAVRVLWIPARFDRNIESEFVGILQLAGNEVVGHALGLEIGCQLFALLVKEVGKPFQEQHAEDVFLVLRGIHVAAQVVAGAEQEIGELAECEFGHRAGCPCPIEPTGIFLKMSPGDAKAAMNVFLPK